MPLTGRHALLECSACHRRQGERTWSDVPADCFACHQKDYRGDLHPDHDGDPADPSLRPLPRDCGQCHRTTGWTPAVIVPGSLARLALSRPAVPPDHDLRFALSFGPHRGAACESCHTARRRLDCTGCHAHGEVALARQHRGRAIGRAAAGCLRCHPGGMSR
jgi:hypothetical protein